MKITNKNPDTSPWRVFRQSLAAGLLSAACMTNVSAALLDDTLDIPILAYNQNGQTTYEADTDLFTLTGTPFQIFPSGAPISASLSGHAVNVKIEVDENGALVGGIPGDDMVVTGEVTIDGVLFSGTLLKGEVTAFGYENSGATDFYDFRFKLTGGELQSLYGTDIVGMTVASESSDFSGAFTIDFGGGAKGNIGGLTPTLAKLGDRVWEDLNGNGVQDCENTNGNNILGDVDPASPNVPGQSDQGPECGDKATGGAGIPGIPVHLFTLDDSGDCTVDLNNQVLTGVDGFYLFDELEPGDYCVKFDKPSDDFCNTDGFALGSPQFTNQNIGPDEEKDSDANPVDGKTESVSLAPNDTNLSIDAGFICPAKIGNFVWEDINKNGIQDGEPGIDGVKVNLYECGADGLPGTNDDILVDEERITDGTGEYMFGAEPGFDLPPGNYYVKFDKTTFPFGFDFTLPKQDDGLGNPDETDSDCLPPNGITACAGLGSRGINLDRDCGLVPPPPPECDLTIDKTCRIEPDPSTLTGKCDGKLRQFSVIWNGADGLVISGINMGTSNANGPISQGDTVTFFGPYSKNDVVVNFTNGQSSTFHMSCSDQDFNGPEDCGNAAGDGKNKKKKKGGSNGSLVNDWLLDGFIDDAGDVLVCTQSVDDPDLGGPFSQNCSSNVPGAKTVTYRYEVTNDGDPVLDVTVSDNLLGEISDFPFDLDTGDSETFFKGAVISETTMNIATAKGILSDGELCPATDKVVVTLPGISDACSQCEGKVTELTLQYNGSFEAFIEVEQKKGGVVFSGSVQPGESFNFSGTDKNNTLGTEITIIVDGSVAENIHTSCSKPIGPGLIVGEFEVLRAYSLKGGLICPVDSNQDSGKKKKSKKKKSKKKKK